MTRSKFEEAFIAKSGLPYEQLCLPYVKEYVPDFHTDKYILELKGVLERDDAKKISSVVNFLRTDKVYVIVGGKFKQFDELRQMLSHFNPTIFKYPDLEYAIAPQFTKTQLSSFRLSRGRQPYNTNFPLTGKDIVAWADRMGITTLPMTYQDHKSWEEYHASFL